MTARQFTPLDILPALSNASVIGIFGTVLYGEDVGISAALGALVLWSGILLYLSRPGAPEANRTQIPTYLGDHDQRQPRVRVGDDAEAILRNFHAGKPLDNG